LREVSDLWYIENVARLLAFMTLTNQLISTGPSPIRCSFFGIGGVGGVREIWMPSPMSKIAGILSRGIVLWGVHGF